MATRKKKTKAGRVDEDGNLCFTPEDLTRYELAQLRVLNDAQAIKLKRVEIEDKKRALAQEMHRLSTDITALKVSMRDHEEELKTLQGDLAKSYGIDLSRVSYDDVTGRITLDGEPVLRG